MTLEALELLVNLAPFRDRFGRAPRRLADFDWRGRGASEELREALDVRDDILAFRIGQAVPPLGHRRAGHTLLDHSSEVGIGRELAARGRPDLVAAFREVTWTRKHERLRGAVACAGA